MCIMAAHPSRRIAMATPRETIIGLEKRFWQSMIDNDTDVGVEMLAEPSLLVNAHGTMKFDHTTFRRMADSGAMQLESYQLSDVEVLFPNADTAVATYRVKQIVRNKGETKGTPQEMADSSTWVRRDGEWRCVMHTETPLDTRKS
jgi:hypothetical protein